MNQCVVHFISSLLIGGAERFALDLAVTQRQAGSDVVILSFGQDDQPLAKEAKRLGLRIHLISERKKITYRQIFKLFDGYSRKIMHLHSPSVLSYIALRLPSFKKYGVKLIYTRHGSLPLSQLKWRLLHKWANPFVNKITFVSQSGLDAFYHQHHWNTDKLLLISNGALIPGQAPKPSSTDKIRLGSVGRMVALKGQRYLLDAIAQLDTTIQQRLEVHFFGDGSERQPLQQQAEALAPNTTVVFHGSILDREIIFDNIDVLVVCSETEGLSLAIMEAMARHIPTIASKVGDNAKLVLPDKTGWLYDYADTETLSAYLEKLSQNQDIIAELGATAHHHIDQNFSMKSTQQNYQKLYEEP